MNFAGATIEPEICHLNEGHSAFAVLERTRSLTQRLGLGYREAWWLARAGSVFTTHTAVDAAFDRFPPDLVRKYVRAYTDLPDVAMKELLGLGRLDADDAGEPFNMTYLALRGCAWTNAVSRQHGEVSRALFAPLFPRWPESEVPIVHITNGVHMPTWDSAASDRLWTEACGKARWRGDSSVGAEPMRALSDEQLWAYAGERRAALVHQVRERLRVQMAVRGERPERVSQSAEALDPNVLTLGFARRFASYKRPNLLLRDPARLQRLLLDPNRPVQLILAGKAHPDDAVGKALVEQWLRFSRKPELHGRVVFLADYELRIASELVQGVDLWINTPARPYEACGTSGMKVLVNGGLNLSVLDGWWAEAWTPQAGWAIAGDGEAVDAEALYRLLEDEVVPAFYARDAAGIPQGWVARMRASLSELTPAYSSNRMAQDYVRQLYAPAAAAYRRRLADGGARARALQTWSEALGSHWAHLHFGATDVVRDGAALQFRVAVYLGDLAPDSVAVELYAEPGWYRQMERQAPVAGAKNGFLYGLRLVTERAAEDFTVRVRPAHVDAVLPAEVPLIAWQR